MGRPVHAFEGTGPWQLDRAVQYRPIVRRSPATEPCN
jgi:hypothetical protein